jgi:hypothetical protein
LESVDAFPARQTAEVLPERGGLQPVRLRSGLLAEWASEAAVVLLELGGQHNCPVEQVPEGGGYGVDVLLWVYIKRIAGQRGEAKRRIEDAMWSPEGEE